MGYKQVIIVRKDLKIGKGKLCAQVAHAAVTSFYLCLEKNPEIARKWLEEGQKKVVLKVDSLEKLLELYNEAKRRGIPCCIIEDAGLTQLPPGTITCIGIGPWDEKELSEFTGNLKLL